MAIYRAKRKTNFTMISNVGLKDNRLSFKAKGLLAYMLSLPDDWIFYESEIVNHATDGRQSVRTGLKELEDNGYLVKYQKRDKGQFANVEWVVSDEPNIDISTFSPLTENPSTEKPTADNPLAGNRTLLNTNNTKYLDIPNTNNTNTANADSDLNNCFERLWSIYPNKKGKPKALQAYKRAVKAGTTDEQIMNGIQSYKQEIQMKKIDRQFIAHGSTWFNNQRWLDEYETGQTADDFLNLDDLFGG